MIARMRSQASTAAGEVRGKVLAARNRFWRPTDFSHSPGAVDAALSRLSREGELMRVRRGLYWRGSKTLLGMAPPRPELIAKELVGTAGVGPAGMSAASSLGLSTQIPARAVIAAPVRPPVHTHSVRFVDRSGREGRRSARLEPLEVALLEVLEDPDRFIETPPEVTIERIGKLFAGGKLDPLRLVRAAHHEPARIRERLRDLLSHIDLREWVDEVPPRRGRITASSSTRTAA